MIRFVDLTRSYWIDDGPPTCAFLDTTTDKFIQTENGEHTFDAEDELPKGELGARMRRLVPKGFWAK